MNPTAETNRIPRLPHLAALDGLRALAVLAVLFYHAGTTPLRGGFLGVEVFFVISGYLITSLLLVERHATGRVDLGEFWMRRARRLLPALIVLLVVVSTAVLFLLPDEAAKIRGDAFSAAAYANNWFQIFSHASYFDSMGRPSLFRHLWSLSVEEQFYILWPICFLVLASRLRERTAAVVLVLSAAASSCAMAMLFNPDVDPTRVYFGTDTRASGMLIGATLAFIRLPKGADSSRRSVGNDILGLTSLASLAGACFAFTEFTPLLYRGGFALVALATATLIAVLVRPGARVTTALLSNAPLRWIGERSYGIYLWHFPVFMLTRPQLDLSLAGAPLLALRFVITLAFAELSYRFVEMPIRRGELGRAWQEWRDARGTSRVAWTLRWSTVAFTGSVAISALIIALALARPTVPPSVASAAPTPEPIELPIVDPVVAIQLPRVYPDLPPAAIVPDTRTETNVVVMTDLARREIIAIGDSVMEGVSNELVHVIGSNVVVDARQGRQPISALTLARELHAAGRLTGTVILHVGNNGIFRDATFEKIMAEFADAQKVIIVNCKVPRAWEQPNNDMLAEAVRRHPNAVLVDWHALGGARPELFWKDGLHLKPAGAKFYAGLIADVLNPAPSHVGVVAMGGR